MRIAYLLMWPRFDYGVNIVRSLASLFSKVELI